MNYDTTWLEFNSKRSNNQVWVILFDGKVISGARRRAFDSIGDAKKSFSHLVSSYGSKMTSKQIREKLQKEGRLEFKNLGHEL